MGRDKGTDPEKGRTMKGRDDDRKDDRRDVERVLQALAHLTHAVEDGTRQAREIEASIRRVERLIQRRWQAVTLSIIEVKGAKTMTDSQIAPRQTKHYKLVAKDAAGEVVAVESATWAVSDPALFTVVPSADGFECDVTSLGPQGAAQLTVAPDADLGPGVTLLAGSINITVGPDHQAVTAEIEEVPAAAPQAARRV